MRRICVVLLVVICGILLWGQDFAGRAEKEPETGVAVAASDNKGPVGQWIFDEGEGTTVADSSGNGKNGYIATEDIDYPVKWTEGRKGKGLEFTAENRNSRNVGRVVIPGMDTLDFSKDLTVELWFVLDKRMAVRENMIDIVTTMPSNYGPGFRLYILCEMIGFLSGEGEPTPCWGARTDPLKTKITPGVWHHLAGTYDGSVFKVYFDGEESAVSCSGLKMTHGRGEITIGSFPGGHSYGFAGIIDEVRIYDYALSPVQILKHARFE